MAKMKKLPHNHLAEGEVTGHFHAAEGVDVYELDNGVRVFDGTQEEVLVTHQEHKPITLPLGKYASAQVREMDHFAEEARPVVD